MEVFSQFLRKEFSEENIEFWLACEEFKTIDSETKMLSKAKYIYTVFCEPDSPKEVRSPLRNRRSAPDKCLKNSPNPLKAPCMADGAEPGLFISPWKQWRLQRCPSPERVGVRS